MEHIPAIHAAKVGMRYPARVDTVGEDALLIELDLSGIAPGRSPTLPAILDFFWTLWPDVVRSRKPDDRIEVVLIKDDERHGLFGTLPADPAWLTWNNGTVRQLAQRIRETDETVLLPVLADALEEAGCTDNLILERCRRPEDDDLRWLVTLLATQE